VIVQIDYSLDTGGFFTQPQARAALETGIQNVASRLLDTLDPIAPGPTGFGFDNQFNLQFDHPSTGAPVTLRNITIPRDTLRVYVGARDLPGTTIGLGGPGGFSASGLPDFLSNIGNRGEGTTSGPTAFDFAPWGGAITFDSATNWSFDTGNSNPGGSFNSFISVVEHEFGHLLGFGTSASWNARVESTPSGLVFTGLASMDEFGGAVPLADSAHWAEGTLGKLGGGLQEAIMDPTTTVGIRKSFTKLDFAGLSDIGWEVSGIPEASPWLLVSLALSTGWLLRRSSLRKSH
jgi:hypothetical protein